MKVVWEMKILILHKYFQIKLNLSMCRYLLTYKMIHKILLFVKSAWTLAFPKIPDMICVWSEEWS